MKTERITYQTEGHRAFILEDDGTTICEIVAPGQNNREAIARDLVHAQNCASKMLDTLYTVLPIIEDAEKDPAYKPGAIARVTAQVREAIKQAGGGL